MIIACTFLGMMILLYCCLAISDQADEEAEQETRELFGIEEEADDGKEKREQSRD